jgi:hypothetical protein
MARTILITGRRRHWARRCHFALWLAPGIDRSGFGVGFPESGLFVKTSAPTLERSGH